MEQKVKDAIIEELKRQADLRPDKLDVSVHGSKIRIEGEFDLDDLAMVVIGSMAGGP